MTTEAIPGPNDARHVGDGLPLAEPHFGLAEIDGVAAELLHRYVEADARAQRRLLEDQRERLAGEQRAAAPIALQTQRRLEDALDLVGGEVGDGQQITSVQAKSPKTSKV